MSTDTVKQNNQLGRDFITYLCYKSDENGGLFKTSGAKSVHLWVGDKVFLADDNTPPNAISYSGEHFTGADLKQAIRSGKKVIEAQFKLETDEFACMFMIRGERFDIANLRILSSSSGADDSDAQFYARMLSIEQINTVLDDLYFQFLGEISGKNWEQEGYRKFQAWLTEKTD